MGNTQTREARRTRLQTNMISTTKLIWIVALFAFDLLTAASRPCENPLTDDVDDIPKLIKNLPHNYKITLKYVNKMEHLHNHCWLHLMVPQFAKSLNNLLHKFPQTFDVSKNYSILNSLTRMINDLLECLTSDGHKYSIHSYKESEFSPEEFFNHFNNMIEKLFPWCSGMGSELLVRILLSDSPGHFAKCHMFK
uniref:Kit ligand n=1 Tax=Crocodylus porosus TaxID=8502 RepID=A0A7M4G0A2_CROPO